MSYDTSTSNGQGLSNKNVLSVRFRNGSKAGQEPSITPVTDLLRNQWNELNALSTYKSDFDFKGLESLERRVVDSPIRGGVTFKTTFKLVNHHASCSKCHYAFELDTYGRGCVHNCTYCYAKEKLTKHGYWNRPYPVPVDLAEVRRTFYEVFETDKKNKWRDVLQKRVPLRLGSMSDSFMLLDHTYRISYELLKILSHYKYPYIVFTRSDLIARDDYLELLRSDSSMIQLSISGDNEELTRKIEPGAPSVLRRLKAIKRLADSKIPTAVRINPLFPIFPDGYYTDHEYVRNKFGEGVQVPRFDLFSYDFIPTLKEYGATTVLAGFVRLSYHAVKALSKDTGIDLSQFFRSELNPGMKARIYSDREVAAYYWKIFSEAKKCGLNFSTCYIGNGIKDYFQYQHLWSNKKDCCDGIGRIKNFSTSSQELNWDIRAKLGGCKETTEQTRKLEISFESPSQSTGAKPDGVELGL